MRGSRGNFHSPRTRTYVGRFVVEKKSSGNTPSAGAGTNRASGTDAKAFELLLGNLREGIHEIATVGEGLGDLRGAIANFQSTLGHAIESLETSLTGQFQQRLLSVKSDMAKKVESVVVDVARISGAG